MSRRSTRKKKDHPLSAVRNRLLILVTYTVYFCESVCCIGNLKTDCGVENLVMLCNICAIVLDTLSGLHLLKKKQT